MVMWNALSVLEHVWSFNKGCSQTGFDVPFNVAMEQLNAF